MSHTVFCVKHQVEAEGLARPPYPGELGERIYRSICKTAWTEWLKHQTMLINEYRLNVSETKAKEFLATEMERFLFGDGSEKPEAYVPMSE